MALDFLRATPERAFRKIESDLKLMRPELNLSSFKRMSSDRLFAEGEKLKQRERELIESLPYGSWYTNDEYMQIKILGEGIKYLAEHKKALEAVEVLAPGYTYYRNVKQFGHRIEGQLCHYLGEGQWGANWINFTDSTPVLKAIELIRHGSPEDFRKIYVEMADGRADALTDLSLDHITESSDDALLMIESYCDSRWDGPWPWEIASPYKLRKIIEDKQAMKQKTLTEMQNELASLLTALNEGEAERFEVLDFAKDMKDKVQSMIENLARLAGEGIINLKDKTRTVMGDETAMKVEHALSAQINTAADSLSKLRVAVEGIISEIENSPLPPEQSGMGGMGGGLGGPAPGGDPMLGNPMADGAPGGDLDLSMDGDDGLTDHIADAGEPTSPERPMKGA